MEKNPFEIKFHNQLVDLIQNLRKIYRRDNELSAEIVKYYQDYKNGDRFNFIHQTVECLESHIEAVRQQDESIFCEGVEVYLLPKLDFRRLWGNQYLESGHKTLVWRYLTNLYVLGCHYIKKNDHYLQKMLESLKIHQMLERETDKEMKSEEEKKAQSEKLGKELHRLFKGIFTEDSFIYEIFNLPEVTRTIQQFKQNPIETLKYFLGNNGQNVGLMVEGIATELKAKIINGELDRGKIDSDIEKMTRIITRLKRDLPKDKRFKKIFDMIKDNFNLDLSESFENPETAMKQFTDKLQESTGVDLSQMEDGDPQKLEELLRNSAQKLEEAQKKQEAEEGDVDKGDDGAEKAIGDFFEAVNDIVAEENSKVVETKQSSSLGGEESSSEEGDEEEPIEVLPEPDMIVDDGDVVYENK